MQYFTTLYFYYYYISDITTLSLISCEIQTVAFPAFVPKRVILQATWMVPYILRSRFIHFVYGASDISLSLSSPPSLCLAQKSGLQPRFLSSQNQIQLKPFLLISMESGSASLGGCLLCCDYIFKSNEELLFSSFWNLINKFLKLTTKMLAFQQNICCLVVAKPTYSL